MMMMTMATASLTSKKKVLRKSLSSTLRSLSQDEIRTQSTAILERVLSTQWFVRANTISCYLSMPAGEVDTSAITAAILHSGKNLFVPKVDPALAGGMDMLRILDEEDLDALPSGVWGIKEPTFQYRDAPRTKGVAFDRSHARLGHGKGYYDRFLSSYKSLSSTRGHTKALFVGLALREQILGSGQVPVGESDVLVDVVVTPDETIIA
ncbi:hypothetical protein B0F90DRAFT_1759079 [Multifurca ochricompacta]|uniref:5-formyltetrahydrofolate cyclo-ligase n=1 Tax=Multifurca ochricompacta TaxID=376703 RepID=A0AAD4LZN5_9AGAM|nr:hypothetical protein B0F90DRAFT_1759079 [Multifurca ochricompacta]